MQNVKVKMQNEFKIKNFYILHFIIHFTFYILHYFDIIDLFK